MGQGQSTGTGRTPREGAALEVRRAAVLRRWMTGESIRSIATALGISKSLAGLDVQIALKLWRENNRGASSAAIEAELDRLNLVDLKAQLAFESSQGPRGNRGGDPAHLSIMLNCSKARRRLLGLDQPARTEVKSEVATLRTFATREQMYEFLKKFTDEPAEGEPKP